MGPAPDIWDGTRYASEIQQRPRCRVSQCVSTSSIFYGAVPHGSTRDAVVTLSLWSLIPLSGVKDVLDCPDKYGANKWQTSQWGGRSSRWCHPSATSGLAYPQMAVVNSHPSQDAMPHGANSISSCTSSPPAHIPCPPEEAFIIHASGAPCFMQAKPGPKSNLICIACNAMTRLWIAGCAVPLTRTK